LKLYLLRHGQTQRNIKSNEFVGQSPIEPLTELGKKQAELLGIRFKKENISFKEIYCSPYTRALDTCNIACSQFTDQKPIIVDELREYSTGEATDKSRPEVFTFEALNEMNELGMHFSHKGGESLYTVEQRASKWLFSVMEKYKNTDAKIAAFSHGMTIKCLIHFIMEFDQKMTWRLSLDNTAISLFDFKFGCWFVKSINDTAHLE